jgi:hypothetical protein
MAQLYGCLYEAGIPGDFKPLACTKQSDGSFRLVVDTELSVDSLTLEINNIQVGSTDNTKNNTTYLKTKADGTVYVEGSVTISNGNPVVYTGNANILSATVTFAADAKHIQIENMSNISKIYISFDSGVTYRTIQTGYILDIDCDAVASIDIKADADTTPYEILTLE